jgi:hypothetical protein
MFQRDFRCCDKDPKPSFLRYCPELERESQEKRTQYLMGLQKFQAIRIEKREPLYSIDAPFFIDKKYPQVGSG